SGQGVSNPDGCRHVARQVSPCAAGARLMPGFLRTVWIVLEKDLVVEARSRELVYTTVFFAVAVVLIFSFSFVVDGTPLTDAAAGILWVTLAFAGTLALGRTFERERQSETLKALLLAPVE